MHHVPRTSVLCCSATYFGANAERRLCTVHDEDAIWWAVANTQRPNPSMLLRCALRLVPNTAPTPRGQEVIKVQIAEIKRLHNDNLIQRICASLHVRAGPSAPPLRPLTPSSMEPPVLAVPDRPQVFKHILAPAPITMKPYSLIFSSEAVEEQFALSRFRAACRPFVGFCGVTILLCVLAALLHPDFAEGYTIAIITYSVIIAARLHLDSMSDQHAARVRFGRGLFWWGSIIWVFTILHLNTNPPEPSGALIAVVVSILWSGVPVYLRLTAFDKTYYAPTLLVDALGVGLLPNWSVLGRPAETICVYGALLIGELIGYTLEQHVRKGWLQVQELLADKSQLNELRALLARIDVVRAFDVNGWEAAGAWPRALWLGDSIARRVVWEFMRLKEDRYRRDGRRGF